MKIYARILFSGIFKSIWSLPGMAERTVINASRASLKVSP